MDPGSGAGPPLRKRRLDEAFTVSSAYLITPVVAEIVYPYPFSINEEEIEELGEDHLGGDGENHEAVPRPPFRR